MIQIARQMRPDPGDERQIAPLAVTQAEPGEDTEDAQVSLRAETRIGGAERRLVPTACGDIAREHRLFESGRHVAARVLQQRDKIIGPTAGHRVLEVEQTHPRVTRPPGQPDQVFGMIVAQDKHLLARVPRQKRRQGSTERRPRPGRVIARGAGAVPVKGQSGERGHRRRIVGGKIGRRGMVMELRQQVGRGGIEHAFPLWRVIEHPREKRLAVPTEDHPLAYAGFEGVIPKGEYGAGTVLVWDTGVYDNITEKDGELIPVSQALSQGHLLIRLHGEKLKGGYALQRIGGGDDERWLLIKMDDDEADARRNPVSTENRSVKSGRTLDKIADQESGGGSD